MKQITYLIQYGTIRFVSWLVCLMPFGFGLGIAKVIGTILYFGFPKRRRMAIQNLKNAFPEKSDKEISVIARKSFIHLTEFGIEWLKMPEMIDHPDRYFLKHVSGSEALVESLKQKKGAVILVTHTANWEVMALMMGKLFQSINESVYAVARPFNNSYLYNYTMKMRAGLGLKSIDKSGGVRETFNKLKENAAVCLLVDQRVSEGGIETNFFGRPALTSTLPIFAAKRLKTPIFFSFIYQTKDLRYELKLEGPVVLQKSGNIQKDILANTQQFSERVEKEIRKNPSHWLWMHNRWRPQHGPK